MNKCPRCGIGILRKKNGYVFCEECNAVYEKDNYIYTFNPNHARIKLQQFLDWRKQTSEDKFQNESSDTPLMARSLKKSHRYKKLKFGGKF